MMFEIWMHPMLLSISIMPNTKRIMPISCFRLGISLQIRADNNKQGRNPIRQKKVVLFSPLQSVLRFVKRRFIIIKKPSIAASR